MHRYARASFYRRPFGRWGTVRACFALSLFALAACTPPRGTIGAVLAQTGERRLVVREAPDGLAAAREGVQPDDEILLIDGRDARAMSTKQIHDALGGEVGEPVKLTLVRDDTVLRVTLRRTPATRHRVTGSGPAAMPE